MGQLDTRLDDSEIKERANNLIIAGVPKQTEYNTKQIAEKILKSLNLEIDQIKILNSFRLKNKEWGGPILLKLSDQ